MWPGYAPPPNADAVRQADERYAADAARWARENCVKAHGDPATGAIVGGLFGALVGGALAGRHDTGAGMFVGGALGAVGGAAIAANSDNGDTSPGCPPGYVVRRDAQGYSYGGPDYYYAAPGWYQPWVFIGGGWVYRPYPYHDWYWHTYRAPFGGGWRGGRGGGEWRGGGRDGGGWHGGGGRDGGGHGRGW